MMTSAQRRSISTSRSDHAVQRPAVTMFLALNLGAWLLFLSSINSSSLRHLNLDDILAGETSSTMSLLSLNSTKTPNEALSSLEALQSRLAEKGVPPVSCSNVLHDARTNASASLDPNHGQLFARYTLEEPHFYISVHNKAYDKVRYELFETTGFYYERVLTDCFRQVLSSKNDGEKRVLDVGGNIGWYALLSAALGAQVATFEPHPPNFLRMCESQCLNDWLVPTTSSSNDQQSTCLMGDTPSLSKHIQIFPYGVSDRNTQLNFQLVGSNPGQGEVLNKATNFSTPLRCVTLDDMVDALGWDTGDIDILKVDVEGAEMGVFLGAKKLLQSNRVMNIFMEGNVRYKSEISEFESLIKLFLDANYRLYKFGGWSGPDSTQLVPVQDTNFTQKLIEECRKPQARQCNLWWKPKGSISQKIA